MVAEPFGLSNQESIFEPQSKTISQEARSILSVDFSSSHHHFLAEERSSDNDNAMMRNIGLGVLVIAGITDSALDSSEESDKKGENAESRNSEYTREIGNTRTAENERALDSSGRPLSDGNRERIAERFPVLSLEDSARSRTLVESELSQYRATDGNGSVLDQLRRSGLSEAGQDRVLNVMAEVREHYVSQRLEGKVAPEQRGSWLHGIGELGEVLEVSRRHGYTPSQTQNSILASLFSDSVKSGWNKAGGGNFFTHHLDGALAAEIVLERHLGDGFERADIRHITSAILEHQISPPSFMGMVYAQEVVNGLNKDLQSEYETLKSLEPDKMSDEQKKRLAELDSNGKEYDKRSERIKELETRDAESRKSGFELSENESKELESLRARQKAGRLVSDAQAESIGRIRSYIGSPFQAPLEGTAQSGMRVAFSSSEKAMLDKYVGEGTGNWHVPDKSTGWHRISYALLTADSLDNYFGATDAEGKPVRGTFKIAALRGFNTPTRDLHLQSGIDGINQSARSSMDLMDPIDRPYAEKRMKETAEVYDAAKERTGEWLKERLGLDKSSELKNIPYWDMPLDGQSKAQVELAGEIQKRFALELLTMRRFDGQEPVDLESVRQSIPENKARTTVSEETSRPAPRPVRTDRLSSDPRFEMAADGTRRFAESRGVLDGLGWRERLTDMELREIDSVKKELERKAGLAEKGEGRGLTLEESRQLDALRKFELQKNDAGVHKEIIKQLGETRPEGGFRGREVAGRLVGISILTSALLAVCLAGQEQDSKKPLQRAGFR